MLQEQIQRKQRGRKHNPASISENRLASWDSLNYRNQKTSQKFKCCNSWRYLSLNHRNARVIALGSGISFSCAAEPKCPTHSVSSGLTGVPHPRAPSDTDPSCSNTDVFLQCLRHSFHADPDTWSLKLIWATLITEKPRIRAQDQFLVSEDCTGSFNKTGTLLNTHMWVYIYLGGHYTYM